MSTPLPPPGSGSGTSTQQIPVVPAAVANTQHLPPPPTASSGEAALDAMRTTGPVEFVPEPPGATAPTEKVFSQGSRRVGTAGRPGVVAAGLSLLAVVALELGLLLSFGTRSLWSAVPLWSAFATLVAAVGLGTIAGPAVTRRSAGRRDCTIATAALACVAVFWLLVVLPVADTDRGFLLTAALGLLGTAVWLSSPGSRPGK